MLCHAIHQRVARAVLHEEAPHAAREGREVALLEEQGHQQGQEGAGEQQELEAVSVEVLTRGLELMMWKKGDGGRFSIV